MLRHFDSLTSMEAYISSKIQGDFSVMDMDVLSRHISKLKSGDKYLEIGVKYGKSIATAVFSSPEGISFYCCDIADLPRPEAYPHLLSRQEFFAETRLSEVCDFILGDSKDVAQQWGRGDVNMIFIDGNHSYEAVKADILGWTPYLVKGGWAFFHDYDITSPGVIKAVDEYIKDSGQYTDFFTAVNKYGLKSSIAGGKKL